MKKVVFMFLAIALLIIPVVIACGPAAPTQVIKLNYANFFPPTNYHSILAEQFIKEITKQTNGMVEIKYFPGGALATAPKIADAVETGIADIGMSVVSYTMGRFPTSEIIEMPHTYPNGWTATYVSNEFYNKFKPKEWDTVKLLYFHAHGPSVIFTTKTPVNKVEDLKGLVIRSTGIGAKILEALGARSNGAGQGDAYELMSKGVVDGSYTPREPLKGWKQAEVVKNVTLTFSIGSTANMFIAMNKAKFNALPSNYQNIFINLSKEWIEKHAKVWTAYDKEAMDFFATFPDRKVISLSEAEAKKFSDAAKPALEAYMAERAAKGLPVADYEKFINEKVVEYAKKAPSEKDCVDWVQKNVVSPPATPAK